MIFDYTKPNFFFSPPENKDIQIDETEIPVFNRMNSPTPSKSEKKKPYGIGTIKKKIYKYPLDMRPSLIPVKWMPLAVIIVVVSDLLVGADAYAKMPDGCKGMTWDDRSCDSKKAVDDWIAGGTLKDNVVATYGPIEQWDMSEVTDMKCLFYGKGTFTADISNWDVSFVTDMDRSKYIINFNSLFRVQHYINS